MFKIKRYKHGIRSNIQKCGSVKVINNEVLDSTIDLKIYIVFIEDSDL